MADSNYPPDREHEISRAIVDLENKLDEETVKAEGGTRLVLLYISHILAILNSEYGMVMRVINRQNKQDAILERLTALLERGNGDDGVNLAMLYRAARKRQKLQWATLTVLLGLVVTSLYNAVIQRSSLNRSEVVVIYHTNYTSKPTP